MVRRTVVFLSKVLLEQSTVSNPGPTGRLSGFHQKPLGMWSSILESSRYHDIVFNTTVLCRNFPVAGLAPWFARWPGRMFSYASDCNQTALERSGETSSGSFR